MNEKDIVNVCVYESDRERYMLANRIKTIRCAFVINTACHSEVDVLIFQSRNLHFIRFSLTNSIAISAVKSCIPVNVCLFVHPRPMHPPTHSGFSLHPLLTP